MKFRPCVAALALVAAMSVGEVSTVSAVGPGSATFVPITPCRLMDTRPGAQVGPRGTPINAGETYAALVWGTNGNCTIPSSATAITLNVTFVAPTSNGFVTVYPPDQPWPGTSNLNFVAGQAPAPNGVTSPLSADGKIGFYNAAGTVHLIADIVGYYEEAGSPDAGLMLGACSAQIRWDLDNCKPTTYGVGEGPIGVAFDGTSVWVVNSGDDTVSRINPETGARVDFATGVNPSGVAFDGTYIWVTNRNSDSVSRIDPATGAKTDFAAGDQPVAVAFDGTSVWVVNRSADSVSRINPTTGTKTDFAAGDGPTAITFDGSNLYVTNELEDQVSVIDAVTGVIVDTLDSGDAPVGVAFDGSFVWVTNVDDDTVSRINPLNNSKVDFPTDGAPNGIAFDGTSLWVTNAVGDTVSKINPVDGSRIDYPASGVPSGVAFDGSNVWVANNTSGRLLKFVAGRGVLDSSPTGASDSSTFVPVTPCRLMDTRPGAQVGPRGTPINPGETYAPMVWGANGNCNIPSSATAVSLNVTFVAPTADGFVAVFPPDKPWPGTSNLNFTAGQAPAPNGVTSPLSADGKIGFLNAFGQVHLLADIVGYYEQATSAPGGLVFGNCHALLRWDLPGCRPDSFDTGDSPIGVAFDGTSIWVTNADDDTVSKINPTSGSRVDYSVGDTPLGIAFDGTSIWVANADDNTVSKINPATGTRVDYSTDPAPTGVAFDGSAIWVSTGPNLQKLNPADGTEILSEPAQAGASGMAFDGTSLWVANFGDGTVSKVDPATGSYISYAVQMNPLMVAFDGSRIWVTNNGSGSISQVNPSNGSRVDFPGFSTPSGIAYDGANIWVANTGNGTLTKVNPITGLQYSYEIGINLRGVAFDGGNVWVTDSATDRVNKVIATSAAMRLSGVASEGATSFVPVTPCRLMDTRPGSQVGPRNTPINAGETYAPMVWGTNGNCTIPTSATALSLNVTFVAPTSGGFATVYPPDKPWPGTSNLNFVAGQAPAPNGVTSPLSADGKIGFFNSAGTVHMLADIVGYYEPVPTLTTNCLPTLRWDLPNCDKESINTGNEPRGLAFDGTHLWSANFIAHTVSKIDPATGTSVAYPLSYNNPYGVAFDGTYIWVTMVGDNRVIKIDPSTGTELADYATCSSPHGIVFDGTGLWVACLNSGNVAKIDPATGARTDYPTGAGAYWVAYDGRYIWVTNSDADSVSQINPDNGFEVDEHTVGENPFGIGFDGTNLWVANLGNSSDSVMKINSETGDIDEYDNTTGLFGDGLSHFAFDGTYMWVTSQNTSSVIRIDVTTGAGVHFPLANYPYGIVFDGESIWVGQDVPDDVERLVI